MRDHIECDPALQVGQAVERYGWDPEEGPWDANFDELYAVEWTQNTRPIPRFNSIFRYVKFKSQHLPPWFHDPHDAKFRVLEPDVATTYQRPLSKHPIAIRSLATFPSVRRLRFGSFTFAHEHRFENVLGITVWDVLRGFQSEYVRHFVRICAVLISIASMDRELTISELLALLNGPFSDIFHHKPSSDFVMDLERFSTLRGLWSAT